MASQITLGPVSILGHVPECHGRYTDTFKVFKRGDTLSSPQVLAVRMFKKSIGEETRVRQRLDMLLADLADRSAFIPGGRGITPPVVIDALTGIGMVRVIVRPWMGQNIFDYVKADVAVDKLSLIIQIAIGIESLHTRGLVHGNISPDNIFVTADGSVSITDAGVYLLESQIAFEVDDRLRVPKHCVYKSADELNIDGTVDGLISHTTAMDIYSWAVTVFAIIIEETPFTSSPRAYMVRFFTNGYNTVPKPSRMSDGLWNILRPCWDEDPISRPSMTEIVDRLEALPSLA